MFSSGTASVNYNGANRDSQSMAGPQIDNQSQVTRMYNRTLLEQLNTEMLITLLPAVVYLVALMLVGTVGNLLVIYILGWKLKFTTQNCLFMWLGVFDVISCVIGIPSEIADICNYYLYENAVACKVMRFLLTIPPIASANLLIVIAVDRYRRVCKPLHAQLQLFHARVGVVLSALVAVVVAGPSISIYGNRTVHTSVPGLQGCDCSVQDKYQGRLYPLLYELLFGTAFIAYTVVLSVLYIRVWMETRRHKRYMASHAIPSVVLSALMVACEGEDSSGVGGGTPASSPGTPEKSRKASRVSLSAELSTKIRKSMRASKLTVLALVITVVFVVSYLPHLCLIILRTVIEDFDHQQTGAKLVVYNIFLRSFFVNSVANVFVYSAMNVEFRQHCKRLCCMCAKSSQNSGPTVV